MARDSHPPADSPRVDRPQVVPTQDHPQVLPHPNSGLPLTCARGPNPAASATPAPPAPGGASGRCAVKGCIFPVARGGIQCLLHDLAEKEPKHFLSVQPSVLLLDQAKFGVPDSDYDDSRARDRRRLAALREKFREEVA